MRLYYHKTDGGAEYLCSNNVKGTSEGSFDSDYIVRIDGNIKEDAELNGKAVNNFERMKDILIKVNDHICYMCDKAYGVCVKKCSVKASYEQLLKDIDNG